MPAEKLDTAAQADNYDPISSPRIICSHSRDHSQISSLVKLGLSSKDIEAITGFNKSEFQHLV